MIRHRHMPTLLLVLLSGISFAACASVGPEPGERSWSARAAAGDGTALLAPSPAPQDWGAPPPGELGPPAPLAEDDLVYGPGRLVSTEFSGVVAGGAVGGELWTASRGSEPDLGYADLWQTGASVNAEARMHFYLSRPPQASFSVGPLLHLGTAQHGGRDETFANRFTLGPERLTITKLLGGFHARLAFGPFFMGGHVGLGFGFIGPVEAILADDVSGSRTRGDLIDSTTTFGFELAFRIGGRFLIGDTFAIGGFGTLGGGFVGPPREGDLIRSINPDLELGSISQGFIGAGLTVEWGRLGDTVAPAAAGEGW